MYSVKKIKDDLFWVGANNRRLAMFEGVYSVPYGVAYNSYLLLDDKTVLIDTVDKAVQERYFENVAHVLGGRTLDYIVVQHVEPDHSAALWELTREYPDARIVCSKKILTFIEQFFNFDIRARVDIITESDVLDTGKHKLSFIMAPMVHWPEVMVTYDATDKILFSADAFGCFGALNGALFADEVDFTRDYMDEARRYYTNIVGKYGSQVSALLDKASALPIEMICPLHGFVWREKIGEILSKYVLWSSYTPEEDGVMIAYASVYGNTENAAEILAGKLRDRGVRTVMFDVSVTPASEIIAAAFQWSHMVIASTTYNAGIFVTMEAFVSDLVAHNIQNRTVAVIENGSWAPTSGSLIREMLGSCKNISIIDEGLSITSSLKTPQLQQIDAIAGALIATMPEPAPSAAVAGDGAVPDGIDMSTMFKLSYGLFVLTARDGEKDNGCIINTVIQVTESPLRIALAVNKANFTHDMVLKTGELNVSVLSESAPFSLFKRFGFQSGKEADKFEGSGYTARAANGIRYIPEAVNGVISAGVTEVLDCGTHTLFIAEVTGAFTLSGDKSLTYQYYFDNIKPKPQPRKEQAAGYVCRICGYVYEGDTIPDDFICPLCKHGVADFDKA